MIDEKFLDELAKELKKLKVNFYRFYQPSTDEWVTIRDAKLPGHLAQDIQVDAFVDGTVTVTMEDDKDKNRVYTAEVDLKPAKVAEAVYKMVKMLPKEAKAASNDSIDRLETLVETRMQGNYNSDKWLFDKVDKFILDNYEDNKKDAKRAVKLLDVLSGRDHGEVSDEDLIEVAIELKA